MATHREKYLKKMGFADLPYNLKELSIISRIPEYILQDVYSRGIGAWKTNPQSVRLKNTFEKNPNLSKFPRSSRLSKEQWAYARVYSFLNGGKTRYTADKDLWELYKKSKKEN